MNRTTHENTHTQNRYAQQNRMRVIECVDRTHVKSVYKLNRWHSQANAKRSKNAEATTQHPRTQHAKCMYLSARTRLIEVRFFFSLTCFYVQTLFVGVG